MAVTEKEYLVLSKLAYGDFNVYATELAQGKPRQITQIDYFQVNRPDIPMWQSDINQMGNWVLINYVNYNVIGGSGYCGAAFKNSDGHIVIANRGTEPDVFKYGIGDMSTDIRLALSCNTAGVPNQFADAEKFVTQTLSMVNDSKEQPVDRTNMNHFVNKNHLSFTGHSLGGGLAEYQSYLTGGASVTFNGVGIGQALKDQAAVGGCKCLNIVNADDLIGNYGIHLGQLRSLAGNLVKSDVDACSIERIAQIFMLNAAGSFSTKQMALMLVKELLTTNDATRDYLLDFCEFKAHGLEILRDYHINSADNSITAQPATTNYAEVLDNALFEISVSLTPAINQIFAILQCLRINPVGKISFVD